MKSKIFFIGAALAVTALLSASCKDFLQEDPKGRLASDTFFATQNDIDMSLTSMYRLISNANYAPDPNGWAYCGDDMTTHWGSNKGRFAEVDGFYASNDSDVTNGGNSVWRTRYNVIKCANWILANVEKAETSEAEINIAKGQAHYWRAASYLYLVQAYGPIPMVLSTENDNFETELSSIEAVYEQIVKDLTDAETELPEKFSGSPRRQNGVDLFVNQAGAKATLAGVYMAMAGYPLNKGTAYYTLAASKAKEVIDGVNSGKYAYALEKEFKFVYAMDHNYSKEVLIGATYMNQDGSWTQPSMCTSANLFESLGGWGDCWPEIKYWKEYPEGPRKDAVFNPQILVPNDAASGVLHNWWDKDSDGNFLISEHHPMFSIFSVNDSGSGNINAPYDYTLKTSTRMTNGLWHRMLRYSEVLCWYAEAVGRGGQGDQAFAMDCLKQVRDRAGYDKPVSAATLAEDAMNEHGYEVAGNFTALFPRAADMLRMNILKDHFAYRVSNPGVEVAPGVVIKEDIVPKATTWNDNMNYLPYSYNDSEKNPNLKR